MTDVEIRKPVPLRSVPGVELAAVGTWAASTGVTTFTPEDLTNAVAALECPGVRNPVIKLGHHEPDSTSGVRWDGEPALGWIGNMHMDGPKLVGDYMGMPEWLTATDENGMAALASAYPDRSIEIRRPFVCQIGHAHPSVITAVALLGVYAPGVGVLKSMQDVYAAYTEPMSADLARLAGVEPAKLGTTVRLAAVEQRDPTADEVAAGIDFAAAQQQWADALDTLLDQWPDIAEAQRAELAAQVEQAVDDDPDALGTLAVATAGAAALLLPAMTALAGAAAVATVAEAAYQGVRIAMPDLDGQALDALADGIAAAMGASTASFAGRTAAQALGTGTGREIAAATTGALADLTDRFLRDQLGGALSAAQAAGRFAVLDAAPPATYVASELLDVSTCEKCREIDGTTFDTLDQARAAYGSGKYTACLGGERCRGRVYARWGAAAGAGGAGVVAQRGPDTTAIRSSAHQSSCASRSAQLIPTTIRTGGAMPNAPGATSTVQASVSVEDISRSYYESAGYSMWITAMHVDPLELIAADDSNGKFFRIPITMSGEAFEFGEPQEVAINYVDVTSKAAASNPARWTNRKAALAAAGKAENGTDLKAAAEPGKAPDGGAAIRKMAATATETEQENEGGEGTAPAGTSASTETPEGDNANGSTTPKEGASMDAAKLREALGLAADAPDSEVTAKFAETFTSANSGTTVTAPEGHDPASLLAAIPKGADAIVLDRDNYKALLAKADQGVKAHEEVKRMGRDAFLSSAVKDGRFPVAKLADYERMYDQNPDAAKSFIELMPKNAVPTMNVGFLGAEVDKNDADLAYEAVYGTGA